MSIQIVLVEAGRQGDLLGAVWARRGCHGVSKDVADLADASIVLYGGDVPVESELAKHFEGKIVVDCGAVSRVEEVATPSRSERLAAQLSKSEVVRAFGVPIPALQIVIRHHGPAIGSVYVAGAYCGNNLTAKSIVAGLAAEANLEPLDCGALSNALLLDALVMLGSAVEDGNEPYALTSLRPIANGSPADLFF